MILVLVHTDADAEKKILLLFNHIYHECII
jgi:hypothetical protein